MAMMCVVCVTREEDKDLYSAYRSEGGSGIFRWQTLPEDAPRRDVERYVVNTEQNHLGVTPEMVTRDKMDEWVHNLGEVRRVQ